MIKVRIPTPLRKLTGGQGVVNAEGTDIVGLIEALEKSYPGLKERLFDEEGALRRFVNIYINEEDIRFQDGIKTPLKTGDEVSIVPAIAGGGYETLCLQTRERVSAAQVMHMGKGGNIGEF